MQHPAHILCSGTLITKHREKGKKRMIVRAENMVRSIAQQLAATPDSGTRSISSSCSQVFPPAYTKGLQDKVSGKLTV